MLGLEFCYKSTTIAVYVRFSQKNIRGQFFKRQKREKKNELQDVQKKTFSLC